MGQYHEKNQMPTAVTYVFGISEYNFRFFDTRNPDFPHIQSRGNAGRQTGDGHGAFGESTGA